MSPGASPLPQIMHPQEQQDELEAQQLQFSHKCKGILRNVVAVCNKNDEDPDMDDIYGWLSGDGAAPAAEQG